MDRAVQLNACNITNICRCHHRCVRQPHVTATGGGTRYRTRARVATQATAADKTAPRYKESQTDGAAAAAATEVAGVDVVVDAEAAAGDPWVPALRQFVHR